MSVLLGAMVPYAVAMVVIFLFWRFLHGKHPYVMLIAIFLLSFALWHLSNALWLEWQVGLPRGIEAWLAAMLLYGAAVNFFLGNYTCIGRDSPSMTLVTLIDEAGPDGCSRDEILRGFRERGHVEGRMDAMEGGGLLRSGEDETLSATRIGRVIRWSVDAWFGLLGHEGTDDD